MSLTEPNILFPTTIKIEQPSQDKTVMDRLTRSPRNFIRRNESFEIEGQVVWDESLSSKSLPKAENSGVDEKQFGHIIVRTLDLKSLGKVLKRNDKIVKLGDHDIELYILKIIFGSHYDGTFRLAKAVFADRRGDG